MLKTTISTYLLEPILNINHFIYDLQYYTYTVQYQIV